MRKTIPFLLCALLLAAHAAAEYPERPIRLISVGAPGGTPDILSRRIGAALTEVFKKQIVVDNRAGGGGIIAAEMAAKAPPDGYTLYMTYHQHTRRRLHADHADHGGGPRAGRECVGAGLQHA